MDAQTLDVGNITPAPGSVFQVYQIEYQPPGPAGTGLIWDFSSLPRYWRVVNQLYQCDRHPGAASFPNANMAENFGDEFYDFYSYTAAGIDFHGSASDIYNMLMTYQDPQRKLSFPCSYNTTWQDAFGGNWMSSTGFPATSYGSISGIADGMGTLIMPYGTVENVLRVSITWNDSDAFAGACT